MAAIGQLVRGVLEPVGVVAAGPALEVAHVRAQTGLVHDRDGLGIGVQGHLAVVGRDVGAAAISIEQVAVGLTVRPDAGTNGGCALEHAHRVAGGRDGVDLDVRLAGAEIILLHVGRQAALIGHGKPGGHLYGSGPHFQKGHRVSAGEDAACGDQRDVKLLGPQVLQDFGGDGGQVVLGPVHAEPQVPAGQWAFHNHIVGQPVQTRVLA